MSYNGLIQCELPAHILPGAHLAAPQLPQSFCVITMPLSGKVLVRGWAWVLGAASASVDGVQACLAPHTVSGQRPRPRGNVGLRETHVGEPS